MKKTLFAFIALCAMVALAIAGFFKELGLKVHEAATDYMWGNGLILGTITSSKKDSLSPRGTFAYSHFDDAAVPAAIVLNPGFQPKYVCIINVTDRIKYEWYDGMAATDCVMTAAAGTVTLDTGSKLSVVAASGSQTSITLAASQVLQNKQYRSLAM